MPELPEVETIRRDLQDRVIGKKILKIIIINKKSVKNKTDIFVKTLKGKKIDDIERIGKLMIFRISDGKYMLAHLRMTGQLVYDYSKGRIVGGHSEKKELKLPNAHTRVILEFADRSKLYFNDLRKFGYLQIVDKVGLEKAKMQFGIEPGTPNFSYKQFFEIIKKRQAPIKSVLLDQKKIAGIGNIYADEILFMARIMPNRIAKSLDEKEIKRVYEASKKIIAKAIKYRGTTFNNYVDARGKSGNFLKMLKVYGRKGLRCFSCNGLVKKIRVAGRGTHFCPECQN